MTSIGNDIVALHTKDANRATQARFYAKIITQSELDLYNNNKFEALPFASYVWMLWSIKEAMYKYQKRHNPALLFSPKKVIVQSVECPVNQIITDFIQHEVCCEVAYTNDCHLSTIHAGEEVLYARSKVYSDVIHTVVNNTVNFEHVLWGMRRIENTGYETQSASVRQLAIEVLSNIFPKDELVIIKDPVGYPILVKNGHEMLMPLSFAHHENFVGYSFLLEK